MKSATSFSGVAIKVYRWLASEWGFASRFKQLWVERGERWLADTNSILKSTPMLRIMFRNYSKWSIMKIEKRLVLLKSERKTLKIKSYSNSYSRSGEPREHQRISKDYSTDIFQLIDIFIRRIKSLLLGRPVLSSALTQPNTDRRRRGKKNTKN